MGTILILGDARPCRTGRASRADRCDVSSPGTVASSSSVGSMSMSFASSSRVDVGLQTRFGADDVRVSCARAEQLSAGVLGSETRHYALV